MRMMQVLAYVIRIPVQYHSVFSLFAPNVLQHCKKHDLLIEFS